jgi:hypothetical protein
MYYINTTLADTNSWQYTSQVQNWHHYQNRDHARYMAQSWAWGWIFVDIQDTGSQYKVHFHDHHGHYRTIFMDHDYRYQRTEGRYC